MTTPCALCQSEPVIPGRTIGHNCRKAQRRERARANAKAHRSRPQPMTVEEFEAQFEAVEGRRVREAEL